MKGKFKIFGMKVAYSNEKSTKIVIRDRRRKSGSDKIKILYKKEQSDYKCDICGKLHIDNDKLHGYKVKDGFRLVCSECEKEIFQKFFDLRSKRILITPGSKYVGNDIENGGIERIGQLLVYPNGGHVLIDFDKDGNELSYDVDPNSVHLF